MVHWQEICADPNVQDLPYKIELNKSGYIIMTPAKNRYSIMQGEIIRIFNKLNDEPSKVFLEGAIKGVLTVMNFYMNVKKGELSLKLMRILKR